jgi:hypothetical protein
MFLRLVAVVEAVDTTALETTVKVVAAQVLTQSDKFICLLTQQ